MKLGIVGLPNVGKSTLFNALTSKQAQSANYPFCTIEPNVGTVFVPDARLDALAALYNPKKVTPAVIEFLDIAGLVKGASNGEGLGNKFLSHVRQADVIVHVVRCFEDGDIVHVEGSVDPKRDVEVINLELIISDLEILSRRIDKAAKLAKGDKKFSAQLNSLEALREHLEQGLPASAFACDEADRELIAEIGLISSKPVIFAANLSERELADGSYTQNAGYQALLALAHGQGALVFPICAQLESDLAQLPADERALFLGELGMAETGLSRLITACYGMLGLISFLTAGEDECRAWTIQSGTKAPQAAGKIHSDFERGFIRAEVVAFEALMQCGGMTGARDKGMLRSEGKEYVVRDGDVILFRFNV